MGEWQPIETAPKDGTPILAHAKFADHQSAGLMVIERSDDDRTWRLSAINSIRLAPTGDEDDDRFPTHWQPLPPPPTQREKEEA